MGGQQREKKLGISQREQTFLSTQQQLQAVGSTKNCFVDKEAALACNCDYQTYLA